MSLTCDSARVAAALSAGVVTASGAPPRVTRGWPKTFEALPCLAVSEASNRVASWRDDGDYIQEIETDIRVFAVRADEIDALARQVESVMTRLDYRRALTYDSDADAKGGVRMKVMRYRVFI
ncbi:MAG: hypothetical protein LBS11_11210 [Oscillospiraceae bacterium]|jgi:hypothetical protein|nr:hypothetical protein [Oscillospiraceae bacterium]